MPDETESKVAALLREAESAHAAFETDVLGGVYDEAWPAWYADYLLAHGLREALPGARTLGVERLAAMLKGLADDYERERPAMAWPEVYAQRLVKKVGEQG